MTKPVTFEEGDDQWRRWRKRCREDLYFLNAMVLGYGSLVPMTPRVHLPLCRFAERKTGIPEIDEARIQLIHIGRGTGKTTCVTIGRTVQRILQNRDWAAGIANETHPNACAMLGVIKSHFESNDLLRKLFPELIPPSFRDTAWRQDRIIVNRTPSGKRNKINPTIRAAGVDSTVTGVHMNEWILDDLISDDAAKAAAKGVFTAIEDANGWIRRVQPLLTRPKQDPITIIGTPWWPGDTYDFIQEHWGDPEDVRTFLWTLKLPGGDHFSMKLVRSGELALFKMPMRDEKGRAIWPEGGLDDESLQAMEAEDPLFFGAQYMLEPSEGEALSFKKEWLKPFEWDSSQHLVFDGPDGKTTFEHLQTLDVVLSVDLAHSRDKLKIRNAENAISVTGTNGRQIFLLESWAERCGPTEVADKILDYYLRYDPGFVVVEKIAYQDALADIVDLRAREMGVNERIPFYYYEPRGTRKDARILGLESYFHKGLFYVCEGRYPQFIKQYDLYPNLRVKDRLDSLAMQRELWERFSSRTFERRSQQQREDFRAANMSKVQRIKEQLGRRRSRLSAR